MNIYEKLNEARQKFHSAKIDKTGHNSFSGYDYFELSDFLVPAMTIFNELKLCTVISFQELLATMTIINIENTDEQIVITSPMGSAKIKACLEVQNIGAVETYQRRYLWVAALEIVEHDAIESSDGDEETKALPTIDDKRLVKAIASIKDGTYTTTKLRETFALTKEQDAKVVAELSKENA